MARRMRLFSVLLCLALVTGCSIKKPVIYDGFPNHTLPVTTATDPARADAVMLKVRCTNEGPFDWDADYWKEAEYILHYDGRLEITEKYSLSGESKTVKKIDNVDLPDIYNSIISVIEREPYKEMDYSDYHDGSTWGFDYYDLNGKAKHVYSGYTDGIEDLEFIQKALNKYTDKVQLPDRAFNLFEGDYFCPDKEGSFVKFRRDPDETRYIILPSQSSENKEAAKFAVTDVRLEKDHVTFTYKKDGKPESLSFKYSDDKNTLTDPNGETKYVRKAQSA